MVLRVTAALLLACAAAAAPAHELWIAHEADGYTLYNGHRHGGHDHADPTGAQTVAYGQDFVREARCYDADGTVIAEGAGGSPWRMQGRCAALTLAASSGYWSKTPYGTRNLPKDRVQQVVKSWRSLEWVKRLDAWSPALARPLTPGLEIVPLEDPFALREGDKLRLLVSFQGRPLAGAVVAYDGRPRGRSDAEGHINIRIRHGGLQSVQAGYSRELASPQADEEVHTAVLNFELPR